VLLSLVVLIVPTALMGSTLPVLSKHLVRQHSDLARRVGFLYSINTLGGATGCVLVGFLLIGWIGVVQSALVASAIYFIIAVAAGSVAWSGDQPAESGAETGPAKVPRPTEEVQVSARSARALVFIFALSGLASIAYEVLWFRLLTYFGARTVYAFAG